MFKASIFLVAAALITLAYGWVSGIDAVLYASIGFSAVAGLALLASTIADRKKYPREEPRREPPPPPREAPGAFRKAQSAFRESPPPPPRRPVRSEPRYPDPEPTFHWSEEEEVASTFGGRDVDQQAGSPGSDDFRSRLAAALAATDDEPPPRRTDPRPTPSRTERRQKAAPPPPPPSEKPEVETEEVEQDWIRIDDLPGMSDVSPATGGLSPARKPRKPKVAEPTDTGRARVRWPPEPEPTEAPGEDEPAAEEQGPKRQGDDSLRPRIRPRQQP